MKEPCFQIGELCANQDKEIVVILSVDSTHYHFVHTGDTRTIITTAGPIQWKKGQRSSQPFREFEKYHYIYEPKF